MDEDAKRWLYWAIPIVVVIGAGGALYYARKHNEPAPAPVAQTQAPPSVEPPVQHPIEQVADEKPLPALAESDSAVQDSLVGALGRSIEQVLVPKDIVRHVVVTIDNLPRKKAAVQLWPVKPIGGELAVAPGGEPTLSPDNAARYAPFIKIVKNADVAQVASRLQALLSAVPAGLRRPGLSGRLLQRSPGRSDRSSARDAGRGGPDQADAARRVLSVRGSVDRGTLRGPEAHDPPRQPECRDREREIARAAQGSREAVGREADSHSCNGRIRGGAIMHKIALVLAIAAIGEGAVTLHLVRQLHEERENAQTLQARVTELERTRAATGSGRDIHRGPDAADGFPVHGRPEERTPPPPQAAAGAAQSSPPMHSWLGSFAMPVPRPTRNTCASRSRPAWNVSATLLRDPEYRDAMLAQQKMGLRRSNPNVARDLDLTPDQADRLFSTLAEQQMRAMENHGPADVGREQPDAAKMQEFHRKAMEQQSANEAELKRVLGEAKFREWQEYQSMAGVRWEADRVRASLANAGMPLDENLPSRC